ncbi:MAG: helix-hairpin-helix domain-containing protein [Myxococcaceae bacterium]|jgi:competence protein ComEA|nr:helix-hairpin-helix domain-containing protein [Myxococcaceae bacterium]
MTRDGWLVVAAAGLLAAGVAAWWRWPSAAPALACAPEQVFLDDAGVARCGPGDALPAGQALTVGQRVPFSRLTADDLAVLPGIGPSLARELIEARDARGGFCSWDEVDAVPGVGAARLEALQRLAEIARCDAGL